MSTPSGYKAWCEVVGLNPFHIEKWSVSDYALYRRWALDQFRIKWRLFSATGYVDLLRGSGGRESVINHVRADVEEVLRPLARNPWQACPCHPRRVGMGLPQDLDREDFPDGMPSRARLLTWLATEFGR